MNYEVINSMARSRIATLLREADNERIVRGARRHSLRKSVGRVVRELGTAFAAFGDAIAGDA